MKEEFELKKGHKKSGLLSASFNITLHLLLAALI
jgi:hypothetical protein